MNELAIVILGVLALCVMLGLAGLCLEMLGWLLEERHRRRGIARRDAKALAELGDG